MICVFPSLEHSTGGVRNPQTILGLLCVPLRGTTEQNITARMPRANKAVKSSENGVTRYVAGYTVFLLCSEVFRYL